MKKVWKKVITLALSVTVIAQTLLGGGLTVSAQPNDKNADIVATTVYDVRAEKNVTVYAESATGDYKLVNGEYVALTESEKTAQISNPEYYTGTRYTESTDEQLLPDENGTLDAQGNAYVATYTVDSKKDIPAGVKYTENKTEDTFTQVDKGHGPAGQKDKYCLYRKVELGWGYAGYAYYYTDEYTYLPSGSKMEVAIDRYSYWEKANNNLYAKTPGKTTYTYNNPNPRYSYQNVTVYTVDVNGDYKLVNDTYVLLTQSEKIEMIENPEYYTGTRYTKTTDNDVILDSDLTEAQKNAFVSEKEADGYTVTVTPKTTYADMSALRINFKYYNFNSNKNDITSNPQHPGQGYNTIKYTVELQNVDGSVVTDAAETAAFYAKFGDLTVNAASVSNLDALSFAQESLEGYEFDSCYWFWSWNDAKKQFENKTDVGTFVNTGKLSAAHNDYASYLGYTLAGKSQDDWKDGSNLYAYNPTGFLHVVYKKIAAPEFTVSAEDSVYDGTDKKNATVSIAVPADATMNYTYFAVAANGSKTPVTAAINAGDYEVVATLTMKNGAQGTAKDTFTVAKAPIVVTFDNQSMYAGGTEPTYTYTISVEGIISIDKISISKNGSIGYSDKNGYSFINAADAQNYAVSQNKGKLTVIDPVAPLAPMNDTKTYNGQDHLAAFVEAIEAEISSDYSYNLVITDAEGDVVTEAVNAGEYTVTVTDIVIGGASVADVVCTLTVEKAKMTIPATKETKTYDAQGYTATVTGKTQYDDADYSITYATEEKNVGTYTLTATVTNGSDNWIIEVEDSTLTVEPYEYTVFGIHKNKTYDGTGDYRYVANERVNGEKLYFSFTTDQALNVGTYELTVAPIVGDGVHATAEDIWKNYTLSYKKSSVNVLPKEATISAVATGKVYGSEDPQFTAVVTGNIEGEELVYTVSRENQSEQAGVYADAIVVTVDKEAAVNNNYAISTVPATFTIGTKLVTITATAANKTYGDVDPTLTATVEGLVGQDEIQYTVDRVAGEDAGEYAITVNPTENANYAIVTVPATFTIDRKAVVISSDSAYKTVGEADPEFTGTVTGLVRGDQATLSFNRVGGEEVGNYTIYIVPTISSNYSITYAYGVLVISEAPVVPEIPETPETPETPQTPATPEAPVVEEPVVEEEPAIEALPDVEIPLAVEPEELPENETPLAFMPEELPENEVPLAVDLREDACWMHWLILALTGVYAVYALARCVARARKIKEVETDAETINE